MNRSRKSILPLGLILVVCVGLGPLSSGRTWARQKWKKITKEEQALTTVPEYPYAPAVILERRTNLIINAKGVGSRRDEYRRVKILSEQGKKFGTISLPSSDYDRIRNMNARTISPDGTIVPLPKDAIFEKKYSDYYRYQITSYALSNVEVGSILEYRYSVHFDNYLRAWEFHLQGELPVLASTVALEMPPTFEFKVSFNDPGGREPERKIGDGRDGARTVSYLVKNLAPIPDEPLRLPREELSARVAFSPSRVRYGTGWKDVQKSWKSLAELYVESRWKPARARSGGVAQMATELTTGLATDAEKATALYRFVRDEIGPNPQYTPETRTLSRILKDRQGDTEDKALLLQALLSATGMEAKIAWSSPRNEGRLDRAFAQLSRVNRTLVVVSLASGKVYLEPGDPDLAFGHLEPELEDVPCLLVDGGGTVWLYTPRSHAEDSQRDVKIEWQVGEEGTLSGKGTLILTGHAAWRHLHGRRSQEEVVASWQTWLDNRLEGFAINSVEVEESVDNARITVSWQMDHLAENILGDEVSIPMAAPLAVMENPLNLPVEQRISPVHLAYKRQDQVTVSVTWPDGWVMDTGPQERTLRNRAGSLEISVASDAAARTLNSSRLFRLSERDFEDDKTYKDLQMIYQESLANDAEPLVLIRAS